MKKIATLAIFAVVVVVALAVVVGA